MVSGIFLHYSQKAKEEQEVTETEFSSEESEQRSDSEKEVICEIEV